MTPEVRHDQQAHRFVAAVEGHEAYISYAIHEDGAVDLQHTFVPPELRGQQLARLLVDAAFAYAKELGVRVIPTCSYVQRVTERVPEYAAMLRP